MKNNRSLKDIVIIDDPVVKMDEPTKLKFLLFLERNKDRIQKLSTPKSSGKHRRSLDEATQDMGSGIYFE